jgi:hypothetical protein
VNKRNIAGFAKGDAIEKMENGRKLIKREVCKGKAMLDGNI